MLQNICTLFRDRKTRRSVDRGTTADFACQRRSFYVILKISGVPFGDFSGRIFPSGCGLLFFKVQQKETEVKINTRSITLAATLSALCAVTGLLPYVFFLPVCVAAATLSVGMAAFVGLAFGCISIAYSFVMPVSLVSLAFVQAPYIAIAPRIVAALGAFGAYKLMCKIARPKSGAGRFAAISVSSALGSLLNTATVVGLFALVTPNLELGGVTMLAYIPVMLISGAIECACMAALTPPVALTLRKTVLKRKEKSVPVYQTTEPSEGGADR